MQEFQLLPNLNTSFTAQLTIGSSFFIKGLYPQGPAMAPLSASAQGSPQGHTSCSELFLHKGGNHEYSSWVATDKKARKIRFNWELTQRDSERNQLATAAPGVDFHGDFTIGDNYLLGGRRERKGLCYKTSTSATPFSSWWSTRLFSYRKLWILTSLRKENPGVP